MNAQLKMLIDLQALDVEIEECKTALAIIPGQIKDAQSGMEEVKKELDSARNLMDSLNKSRKQLELNVQDENDHMAKTKSKLPTVKTNKEYSALLTEIDAIKEKIAKFEDQELEIMESLEGKEKELPAIEARFKEEEERYLEYKKKKETESDRMKKDLQAVLTRRKGLVEEFEPKWSHVYDKVFSLREGKAVVPLKGGVCQGCFQQVQPQMVIDVKLGENVLQCPSCSRFLYWIEESETETAMPK